MGAGTGGVEWESGSIRSGRVLDREGGREGGREREIVVIGFDTHVQLEKLST